jgi:acetoin utilization deacetylase AcuC-like enzyme
LPIPSLEGPTAFDLRRADLVAWYLVQSGAIVRGDLRTPSRVSFQDLALVHDVAYLERLDGPDELARIFGVDGGAIPIASTLDAIRLACGGTVGAAREALRSKRATLNLFGGFHHAGRAFGGGLCALNDVAVAVAVLRRDGWRGTACVIDLDAHPPDGLADCLAGEAWIASISGAQWAALAGVDETVLPAGTTGAPYLAALDALLARVPRKPDLAFVIAGGDVLAGDRLGSFALTRADVRERNARVHRFLGGVPAVWLPAGGYSRDAWKVLAETAALLATGSAPEIGEVDPLRAEFARLARGLGPKELEGSLDLDFSDVLADLGMAPSGASRFLDYYSASGLELALERYGFLGALRRLEYGPFRVAIDRADVGDRVRLFGHGGGEEHLLLESVMAKASIEGRSYLYLHWLTLRHPLATFTRQRPQLPDQEVPGLGLSREVFELCTRIAARLSLVAVAMRPAWYHTAFAVRHDFRFFDTARQGRFDALVRDLRGLSLLEATRAVEEGRVSLAGERYRWEPDLMIGAPVRDDAAEVALVRDQTRFTVAPIT